MLGPSLRMQKKIEYPPPPGDPRSGLLQMPGERLFQNLAVLGKMSIYVRLLLI